MYFSGTGNAKIITMQNKCDFTIWPGYQIVIPLAEGGRRNVDSGFELSAGKSVNFTVVDYATIWGRTGCSFNESEFGSCITGDCEGRLRCGDIFGRQFIHQQPVTYAYLEFGKNEYPDFFAINVGAGYNAPISIIPYGGSDAGDNKCKATSCSIDLKESCPDELKQRFNGITVACRNPCFHYPSVEPQFCCPYYGYEKDDCKPTNYFQVFEAACPSAGSTPEFDISRSSMCSNANNYLISFC
ncbi:pathogenesis-related thaumatin-like protein 3.5 [Manihot esculenta]|uniref:pathogenesis-related thaumatin-like protein 3.5 n=1 Tax=Manihot esculenta TaxID=3983 RepID=UPI000B5D685B|nr:pathogenesis-related thaumatin-like protein 3.5 [Manihot esculenta]